LINKYIISYLIRSAQILWVPGKASRKYFENKNFSSDKIIEGAYCLDQKSIVPEKPQMLLSRDKFRQKQGIDQCATVFLAVGKFIEERRYANLVNAFISMCKDLKTTEKCALILVGDGGTKEELEARCKENGCDNIYFLGAIPFERLTEVYSASDVFVHPGAEPYSTAMEYAGLFGLHIITTRNVGYTDDLMELGAKPTLIDIDDIYQLNDALRIALSNADTSCDARERFQNIANQRSIAWAASQFENVLVNHFNSY
jgi:glycosyltransferase involved in cell wall biosynthesis